MKAFMGSLVRLWYPEIIIAAAAEWRRMRAVREGGGEDAIFIKLILNVRALLILRFGGD